MVLGHFFWIDPDGKKGLDLVSCGDPHHKIAYGNLEDDGYSVVESAQGGRFERFAKRADRFFDEPELQKVALDIGDAYPGQEPEAQSLHNQEYQHDSIEGEPDGDFNFIIVGDQVEASPFHSFEDLLGHFGLDEDYRGPMALGTIDVTGRTAFVHVMGTLNARSVMKLMRKYVKSRGWLWGGMMDLDGFPIDEDVFFGKSSSRVYFSYLDSGDVEIAHRVGVLSSNSHIIGYLDTNGVYAKVQTLKIPTYPLSMRRQAHNEKR